MQITVLIKLGYFFKLLFKCFLVIFISVRLLCPLDIKFTCKKAHQKKFTKPRQHRNNNPLSYILTEIDCQSACAKRVARQNKSKYSLPLSTSVTNTNRFIELHYDHINFWLRCIYFSQPIPLYRSYTIKHLKLAAQIFGCQTSYVGVTCYVLNNELYIIIRS